MTIPRIDMDGLEDARMRDEHTKALTFAMCLIAFVVVLSQCGDIVYP